MKTAMATIPDGQPTWNFAALPANFTTSRHCK